MFGNITEKAAVLLLFFVLLRGSSCVSLNAIPVQDATKTNEVVPSARSLLPACEDGILDPTCIKLSIISLIERIGGPSEYTLYPGLRVVRVGKDEGDASTEKLQEISRAFPDDPDKQVDSYLSYKFWSFLESHSVKFDLLDEQAAGGSRGLGDDDDDFTELGDTEEARKKKKLKKKKLKLLAVLFGFKGIIEKIIKGLITFKIYIIAKKALFLSVVALIGLVVVCIKTGVLGGGGGGGGGGLGGLAGLLGGGGNGGGGKKPFESWGGSGGGHGGGYDSYSDHGGYARYIDISLPERLSKKER